MSINIDLFSFSHMDKTHNTNVKILFILLYRAKSIIQEITFISNLGLRRKKNNQKLAEQ